LPERQKTTFFSSYYPALLKTAESYVTTIKR